MPDDPKKTGTDDQSKLTDDPAFQQLQKAVSGLAQLAQQQQKANSTLQETVNNLVSGLQEQNKPRPKEDLTDDDLDKINDLDNVGLMKLVTSQVSKVVSDELKKVTDDIGNVRQSVHDNATETEIRDYMKDHPDLMDWKVEVAALAKENPNLSIARLHTLARSENPDKAKEVDAKYSDETDESKDKGVSFLSLMPTSGDVLKDDPDKKPLTKDEASEKAWEETIAQFPGLAVSGGDGDL